MTEIRQKYQTKMTNTGQARQKNKYIKKKKQKLDKSIRNKKLTET